MILQDFSSEELCALQTLRGRFWMRYPDFKDEFEELVLVKATGQGQGILTSGLTEEKKPRQFITIPDGFFELQMLDQMGSIMTLIKQHRDWLKIQIKQLPKK